MRMLNTLTLIAALTLLAGCSPEKIKPLNQGSFATPPETVSIRIKGYKPKSSKTFQNLFVSNFSVKVDSGRLLASTARDGLTDQLKTQIQPVYGFQLDTPESVVTGFSDLMLFESGITIGQQPLMYCASNLMGTQAGDSIVYNDARLTGSPLEFLGLRDCQKIYMGLNPSLMDSNANGIPDYLELRCGMNPLNKNQAFLSTSGDGVLNIDKCKRGLPLDEDSRTQANRVLSLQYSSDTFPDGSTDFLVTNIPVLNGGDQNFIAFYITETDDNKQETLYTAFMILKPGYVGKTIDVDYWATTSANYLNHELVLP